MKAKKKRAAPVYEFGLDDLVAFVAKFENESDGDFAAAGGIGLDRVLGAMPEIRALQRLAAKVRQHRDGVRFVAATDTFTAYNEYERLHNERLARREREKVPTQTNSRSKSCRGAGESVGRAQGGARWQNRALCSVCKKKLTLTKSGRIPKHVPKRRLPELEEVVDGSFEDGDA